MYICEVSVQSAPRAAALLTPPCVALRAHITDQHELRREREESASFIEADSWEFLWSSVQPAQDLNPCGSHCGPARLHARFPAEPFTLRRSCATGTFASAFEHEPYTRPRDSSLVVSYAHLGPCRCPRC
ncbi:hypothetical protein SRHO_G00266420 [Serrasalmus rhombeus]